VDKLYISNLSDNFFAIIVPTEYDCLMASTRKKEIVNVIVKAIKSTSEYEPEVASSNRFEYHAAAEVIKVVEFEDADGMFNVDNTQCRCYAMLSSKPFTWSRGTS